jgi:hypothetical protein
MMAHAQKPDFILLLLSVMAHAQKPDFILVRLKYDGTRTETRFRPTAFEI